MSFKGREVKLCTVDPFNKLTDNSYEDVRHFGRMYADIMHCVNNDLILAPALLFTYLCIHSVLEYLAVTHKACSFMRK
jgi:hypothetical protein